MADHFRSRFEELEKQLEQIRSSITPAKQVQPAWSDVTDGSAPLKDSLGQNPETTSLFSNQVPVSSYVSEISSEVRPEEESVLPPASRGPQLADERRETLRRVSHFAYVFTPASGDRCLGLITVHRKQIDELYRM